MSLRRTYIYGLTDPRFDDVVRYIGKTRVNLHYRLRVHLNESTKGTRTHRNDWIRSVRSSGVTPSMVTIDEGVWSVEEANEREIYWIARFKDLGCDLTNGTLGGDGNNGQVYSPETRKKMSQSALGRKKSEETRRRMSEAQRTLRANNYKYAEHSRKMGLANRVFSADGKPLSNVALWKCNECDKVSSRAGILSHQRTSNRATTDIHEGMTQL